MEQDKIIPNKLTVGEKFQVALIRKVVIPLIEKIEGKGYAGTRSIELSYGKLPDEKMDYTESATKTTKGVAIVHFHGGGFLSGSKGRLYRKPIFQLSDAGYPVFSVNYPLAPEHPHPFILRSLFKSLAFIKKHYPEYNEIHLMGDSAGAHLSMMLGIIISNPNLLPVFDTIDPATLPKVKSIVPMYGVFDSQKFIESGFPFARLILKAYAGKKILDSPYSLPIPAMPVDMPAFEHLPPTFIVVGSKDELMHSSIIYAEHLRKQYKQVDLKIYEGAKHLFFSYGAGSADLLKDLLNFYNQF